MAGRPPRWARTLLIPLLLVACSNNHTGGADQADGVLDCPDGEIPRVVEASESGDDPTDVATAALAQWAADGYELVEVDESWSMVVDGRDVAIALPESEGDGMWAVRQVQVCGEPETGPAPIEGSLDCPDEMRWIQQAAIDANAKGLATPEEALIEALEPYQERNGGEIVLISETIGSLVIEQREQVIAFAIEAPAGGWMVVNMEGCGDIGT